MTGKHGFLKTAGLLVLSLYVAPLLAAAPGEEEAGARLTEIAAGDHRSEANKARDVYRNPVDTLLWFGLREDMTVVEIFPGGGWYTEIIAPFVRDKGRYYGAGFDPDSRVEFQRNAARRFKQKLAESPELYGKASLTILSPPDKTAIAPPGSADMVLTFRNVHNWMAAGTEDAVFEAMFRALKPGGILGLVEHRGDPAIEQDPKARSGYVNEGYVIDLAAKAGFVLVDEAEINANPNDTKDYEKGVWTLPPTLALGDDDRDRFLAIGESDRMTLKFKKPE